MLDRIRSMLHQEPTTCPADTEEGRRPLKEIEKRNKNERLKSQMILAEARQIHREIATGNWAADALFNRTGRHQSL